MRLTNLTTYAAIAGALATPLALAAPASATAAGTGSAFGISASGLVPIPPTPAVSSSAKQPTRKSLAELPPNPLVSAGVLNVSAWAGHGRASVADVKLAQAGLSASAITAKCENNNGVSHLTRAVLAGRKLQVNARPNSAITVPVQGLGSVSLILNKQVRNADGGLTVTAIELSLALPQAKAETISIASVTCGPAVSGEPTPPGQPSTTPTPSPTTSTPPGEAPVPTPVPSDLPVTG